MKQVISIPQCWREGTDLITDIQTIEQKNGNNQALFTIEFQNLNVITHDIAQQHFLPIRGLAAHCLESGKLKCTVGSQNSYSVS